MAGSRLRLDHRRRRWKIPHLAHHVHHASLLYSGDYMLLYMLHLVQADRDSLNPDPPSPTSALISAILEIFNAKTLPFSWSLLISPARCLPSFQKAFTHFSTSKRESLHFPSVHRIPLRVRRLRSIGVEDPHRAPRFIGRADRYVPHLDHQLFARFGMERKCRTRRGRRPFLRWVAGRNRKLPGVRWIA